MRRNNLALSITADGLIRRVVVAADESSVIAELRGEIGCDWLDLDPVEFPSGIIVWIDASERIVGRINAVATGITRAAGLTLDSYGNVYRGNVVITGSSGELIVGLTPKRLRSLEAGGRAVRTDTQRPQRRCLLFPPRWRAGIAVPQWRLPGNADGAKGLSCRSRNLPVGFDSESIG